MRRKIIAGNWKIIRTSLEAVALAKEVVAATKGATAQVTFA